MKRFFLILTLSLCSLAGLAQGRSAATITINEANVDVVKPSVSVLSSPLIADIEIIGERVTYVERDAFKSISLSDLFSQYSKSPDAALQWLKSIALSNAIQKYGADLFISFNITTNTNQEGHLEITVQGYPAKYVNFRKATYDEVTTAYYARLATDGKEADPLQTDDKPAIIKK